MTHEEEYMMLNEAKCSGRCSGIGAIKYEYEVKYFDRFGVDHIYGDTLREVSRQLDMEVSPDYNKQGLYVEKAERDGGPVVETYFYEYNPRTKHWTRKYKLKNYF